MTERHNASPWYLAQLKPNCSAIAERNLARQGFVSFLPLERITIRKGKQLANSKRPYFPGYIFVKVEQDSAPWRVIQSTQGVTRLISFGAEPTPVPPNIVSGLRQACDAECCITAQSDLAVGAHVRIAQGPFASFIGQVERSTPEQRVWILLDVMGKATRVSLQRSDVRIAR
uniref:transcription termination/antitermination protein NusG n=1 Tax=uncultured Altererythrobacter sp. TaxID=500840 RepID=UPI00262AC34F|nr:transcription termination/antitermination NusG family protein [uncultured Altererythrobacter sp.]